MLIYLDDDLDSNLLIALLRQEGHEVISPRMVGTRGVNDDEHLLFAASRNAVTLTANTLDFVQLHFKWETQQQEHGGILIVYRENNPARDMNFHQIAKAVTRIGQSGLPLVNTFHNLTSGDRADCNEHLSSTARLPALASDQPESVYQIGCGSLSYELVACNNDFASS